MTKQELEKAIDNGESVWCIFLNEGYEIKIKNHTNRFINTNGNEEMYNYTDENGTDRCFPIKALYKTKAEAEHYLHHVNISRVEQLPFLTWEEFSKINIKDVEFTDKKLNLYNLSGFGKIKLYRNIDTADETLLLELPLTEANFYKAYDECVRLFRGEV